jgi:hypothetical protein
MHKILLLSPDCSIGGLHVKLARVPIAGDRVSFLVEEGRLGTKVLYVAEVEEVILYDENGRGPFNKDVTQIEALAYIKMPIAYSKYTSIRK